MKDECFVIMPIGTQEFKGKQYTKEDLQKRYFDIVKPAIESVSKKIEVIRIDEVPKPGSITNDIFNRIMYSKYVIADISLPSPNVFYELGIRHAIRTGTILIKDKDIKNTVFDIYHLRYIEYENTPTGLKELSEELKQFFQWIDNNPQKPDNQFLELASLMKYPNSLPDDLISHFEPFMKNPEMTRILLDTNITQREKNSKILDIIKDDPNSIYILFKYVLTERSFSSTLQTERKYEI